MDEYRCDYIEHMVDTRSEVLWVSLHQTRLHLGTEQSDNNNMYMCNIVAIETTVNSLVAVSDDTMRHIC
jgi:hypothetical protein